MINSVNGIFLMSMNVITASIGVFVFVSSNLMISNVAGDSSQVTASSSSSSHHHHHHPTSPPSNSVDHSHSHSMKNQVLPEMTSSPISINNDSSVITHNSHHHGDGMSGMMRNYFHSAFGDTILFKGWDLQSSNEVVIACLSFFLLAILYEALKSFREILFRREARSGVFRLSLYNPTNGCPDDLVPTSNSHLSTSLNNSEEINETAIIKCSMWSKAHICQSVLHSIQVVISYTLMLGFMTFNSFVCLSIVAGAGIGYFLFCWRKSTFINVTDHCN